MYACTQKYTIHTYVYNYRQTDIRHVNSSKTSDQDLNPKSVKLQIKIVLKILNVYK